jgi:hypothetical protein
MDTFRHFHRTLTYAFKATQSVTHANLDNVGVYTRMFIGWWTACGHKFAEHYYESQNFQQLNNRMLTLLDGSNLITFAASIQEVKKYADLLAEEFGIMVDPD